VSTLAGVNCKDSAATVETVLAASLLRRPVKLSIGPGDEPARGFVAIGAFR